MIPGITTFTRPLGNGVTTAFPFNGKIFLASDLAINLIDTNGNVYSFTFVSGVQFSNATLALTATISSVDVDSGCTVTFSGPVTTGWTVDIRSNVPELQLTSIKNQGSFLPELHEEAFDSLTRQMQDLRRLTYTFGIHGTDLDATPWPSLGLALARKNTVLTFDGSGLPAASPLSSIATLAVSATAIADTFTGTGSQTIFTLSQTPASTANVDLSLDGASLLPTADYVVSGVTLTLTNAPLNGQKLLARYYIGIPAGVAQAPYYGQTAAEILAGVMPSNTAYPQLDARRYGGDPTAGIDSAPAILAAISVATFAGGGTVYLCQGIFKVTSTIRINVSDVRIAGEGTISNSNSGTGSASATALTWGGAANGIMVEFASPSNAALTQKSGVGFSDVQLFCNGLAGIGLSVASVRHGSFQRLHIRGALIANYKLSTLADANISDPTGVQHCLFDHCTWRGIDSIATKAAHGMWLTSNSLASGANVSLNEFIDCYGLTSGVATDPGIGLFIERGDNNVFINCSIYRNFSGASSTPGIQITGNSNTDSNHFIRAASGGTNGIVLKGTVSGYTQNTTRNSFWMADKGNNTLFPVADAGCTFTWVDSNGQSTFNTVSTLGKTIVNNNAGNYTVPVNTTYVGFTGTQAASVLFTFPAAAAALDGFSITVFTAAAVGTASTWASAGATFVGAPATLAANSTTKFIYDHASLQWLRA